MAQVDALVGSSIALGAALLVLARSARKAAQVPQPEGDRPPTERWTDLVSALVALGSVITVVVTSLNLFVPATPTSLSTPACPGAPVRHSCYTGLTAGEEGVNSRGGPSRAYVPNGRFPKGCSVGFEYFCVGEPIPDGTGSTKEITWVTSRWLVVSRQRSPAASWLARVLSGEVREDRYVSDAFVTPQTRYDKLPFGGMLCRDLDRYPLPDKAVLSPYGPATGTLSAHAEHARNMGSRSTCPATPVSPTSPGTSRSTRPMPTVGQPWRDRRWRSQVCAVALQANSAQRTDGT